MNSKRKFSLLLFCCMAYLFAPANESQLSSDAVSFYETNKFTEAIKCYEAILKNGFTSWKLHFNLGNAYYKNAELGKAIFHYEIANKLDPGNTDVKTNLSIANSKITDKIDSKENFLVSNVKGNLLSLLSTQGWAWLSISSSLVACVLFFLFTLSKSSTTRRTTFWSGFLSGIVFVASMAIGFASLNYENKKSNGIVLVKICKVKNAPSENSNLVFSLHEGTKVSILEKSEEWVSIQLSNGNEGWIKSTELGLF